jgi:hypothetical protein
MKSTGTDQDRDKFPLLETGAYLAAFFSAVPSCDSRSLLLTEIFRFFRLTLRGSLFVAASKERACCRRAISSSNSAM